MALLLVAERADAAELFRLFARHQKSGKRGKEDVTVRSILEKTLAVMPEEVLDAPPPQTDLPPVKREPRSGEASDSEGEGGARDGKQQQREAAAVG